MTPLVVSVRYEYLGSVKVDGLCPKCFLPAMVESIGVISIADGTMLSTRTRHCTDCGWGLP